MYFTYRDYQHAANEVTIVSMKKRRRLSPRGYMRSNIVTMELHGEILETTQAAFKTKIAELEEAYSEDGGDAIFYHDDGTPSEHQIISANTMSGTVVRDLSYPFGMQPEEYATQRKFRIVLEAEHNWSEKQVLFFHETLRWIGNCGPRWKAIETAYGPPVVQSVSLQTVQKVIQEGQAIGLDGYPIYPGPLFDTLEHGHLRDLKMFGPKEWRNKHSEYGIRWRYVFSSGIPLSGQPFVYGIK